MTPALKHLLVVAPNWLGDAVMSLPAIEDVHRASEGATITVAARASIAPLFTLAPHIHEVIVLGDGGRDGGGAGLRGHDFGAALLFPNSFQSALGVFRARIPERWGYRTDWRGCLLTRSVRRAPAGVHQIAYYQLLVRALGFPSGSVEPRLHLSAERRAAGAALLEQAGWDCQTPLVAIAPGAAYGGAKRWPPKRFAQLIEALAADRVMTVLIGGRDDLPTGREIMGYLASRSALNLMGATDLPSLAGVLATCRTLVSNDSGALHLAAAVGVRVIALFGPTDERVTGPGTAVSSHTILKHPVWCRPCLLRECPLDHECMRGIQVDAVVAQARRSL